MYILVSLVLFFFFKQKTAYEMRISDWSSDVCSSDLVGADPQPFDAGVDRAAEIALARLLHQRLRRVIAALAAGEVDEQRPAGGRQRQARLGHKRHIDAAAGLASQPERHEFGVAGGRRDRAGTAAPELPARLVLRRQFHRARRGLPPLLGRIIGVGPAMALDQIPLDRKSVV